MGQGFRVLDLDGRTQFGLGKLGEDLPYERTTAEFIDYLRLPPKKHNRGRPDSPSDDEVKKWVVLCPDPRAWSRRYKRCSTINEEEQEMAASEPRETGASIQTVPADIQVLLFDMVEEFADVLCLALTSESMFRSGEKRIIDAWKQERIPWAGKRLICVGDYLKNDDMPPGLLTSGEQEELDQWVIQEERQNPDWAQPSIYGLAQNRFRPVYKKRTHPPFIPFLLPRGEARINEDVFDDIVAWLEDKDHADKSKPKDDNHELILRNLTKKEYVRRNSTSTALGTILLARICWSSDPSCSMAYDGHDLTRGVWAGDRFDIITLDQLQDGMSSPEWSQWTDASEEVNEEMACIWESEFGPEWEERDRW